MIHCFKVDDAAKYGLDEAIFIENVRLWLNSNQAAKRNFHEGKYWTYNTAEAYAVLFPYWNAMKVHRITKSLEDQGVLQVGFFNTNSYNRTKWYTFTDQFANLQNRNFKSAKSSNTDINTDTSLSGSIPTVPFNDLIDIYEKHLPELPVVRKSLFATGANAKATKQRWDWVMTSVHEKGARAGQRLAQTPEQALEWFDKFFGFVSQSDFLTGRDKAWTGCNLGWLMNRANFEKVLSGQYHKKD